MQSDASGSNPGDVPAASTSKKSIWGRAKEGAAKTAEIGKQTLEVASDVTRGALETGKQAYTGSKLESAVNYIDGELDQRGAKKATKDTTGAVVGKLDQVTGKRLVELLEEKLRIQDAYNDVLATRLSEALERIAKLETRFNED
jgi:hypothetical protein